MKPLHAGDPRQVGPYRLAGRLGAGGMGQVYLGHSAAGRPVAVKVVRAQIAEEEGFRERFRREVAIAMKAGGFWTAAVVDADPDAEVPWVASQYVPGPSLAAYVAERGPLDERSVRFLAAGLAETLAAFHADGLVHRDLKPANILLADDGPRVIDFGISTSMDGSTRLTSAGTVLGTPGFMSPEQAVGASAGPPSDVFSLGAVLTFAASGRGPFGEGPTHALLYRVVHDEPDLSAVPAGLRPLVASCLDKDPERRPTAGTLLVDAGWSPASGPPPGWPAVPEAPRAGAAPADSPAADAPGGTVHATTWLPARDGAADGDPADGTGPVDAGPGTPRSTTRLWAAGSAAMVLCALAGLLLDRLAIGLVAGGALSAVFGVAGAVRAAADRTRR